MTDAPKAWKFVAEIEAPDGSLKPRLFYINASTQAEALDLLKAEHPSANPLGQPEHATEDELAGSGGPFIEDEKVRCVRI